MASGCLGALGLKFIESCDCISLYDNPQGTCFFDNMDVIKTILKMLPPFQFNLDKFLQNGRHRGWPWSNKASKRMKKQDPLVLPHKIAFPSKTKTIRHVSLAWQAMKRHEPPGLVKKEGEMWWAPLTKGAGPKNIKSLAPITWKSWT
jgi:hypothetical protein